MLLIWNKAALLGGRLKRWSQKVMPDDRLLVSFVQQTGCWHWHSVSWTCVWVERIPGAVVLAMVVTVMVLVSSTGAMSQRQGESLVAVVWNWGVDGSCWCIDVVSVTSAINRKGSHGSYRRRQTLAYHQGIVNFRVQSLFDASWSHSIISVPQRAPLEPAREHAWYWAFTDKLSIGAPKRTVHPMR